MNISGIRAGAGFYNFSNIQGVSSIPQEPSQKVFDEQEAPQQEQKISQEEIDAARSRQTYDSGDYAKEYQADQPRELKGEYSDLRTLDVEKAISDMQKDQMLSQYQYFVGESKGFEQAAAARGAEDFSL